MGTRAELDPRPGGITLTPDATGTAVRLVHRGQTRLGNESGAYLGARERFGLAEIELMHQRERVAALSRALPPGAEVADYLFEEGPADLDAGATPAELRRA